MQAAAHGATFPMAKKLRGSMTLAQLHDFAVGSEKGKPEHVKKVSTPRMPKGPAPAMMRKPAKLRGAY